MTEQQPPGVHVGSPVIYCDSHGVDHDALVTAVWNPFCVNVVFVSTDESKSDQYGRQIERETSIQYMGPTSVHGVYFRMPGEDRVPYQPPQEV